MLNTFSIMNIARRYLFSVAIFPYFLSLIFFAETEEFLPSGQIPGQCYRIAYYYAFTSELLVNDRSSRCNDLFS